MRRAVAEFFVDALGPHIGRLDEMGIRGDETIIRHGLPSSFVHARMGRVVTVNGALARRCLSLPPHNFHLGVSQLGRNVIVSWRAAEGGLRAAPPPLMS